MNVSSSKKDTRYKIQGTKNDQDSITNVQFWKLRFGNLNFLVSCFLFLVFFASSLDAATLSGTVKFVGEAPERKPIDMNADPACSGFHSEPALSEEVLVNENGTLRNVFVYIKGGLEGQTFETPSEKVILDQQGCRYIPRVFGLQTGQKLEILNTDPTLHNVHGMPENSKEFNLGMPIKGMKLKRKFDAPEVMVRFKCDVHPWMRAYAGVLEHPFFSVTDEQGNFEIKDLPDGEYTVEVWHEKYGTKEQVVSISETANIEFSFGE